MSASRALRSTVARCFAIRAASRSAREIRLAAANASARDSRVPASSSTLIARTSPASAWAPRIEIHREALHGSEDLCAGVDHLCRLQSAGRDNATGDRADRDLSGCDVGARCVVRALTDEEPEQRQAQEYQNRSSVWVRRHNKIFSFRSLHRSRPLLRRPRCQPCVAGLVTACMTCSSPRWC
jgi:hypothetical protein